MWNVLLLSVATICQINEVILLDSNEQHLKDLVDLRCRVEFLRNKVQNQVGRIRDMGMMTSRFQHDMESTNNSSLLTRIQALERKFGSDISGNRSFNVPNSIFRAERLSMQRSSGEVDTGGDDDVIAFYAYISQIQSNLVANQTLIFDTSLTNEGKSYNPKTGVFLTPQDGVYVFMWKIRLLSSEHSTELVINGVVYGATFLRAKSGDDGSVTGTVVARLSAGDVVFVRTHSLFAGDGIIHSNEHGRPFFAGWKLK